jgi:hypothetical protein
MRFWKTCIKIGWFLHIIPEMTLPEGQSGGVQGPDYPGVFTGIGTLFGDSEIYTTERFSISTYTSTTRDSVSKITTGVRKDSSFPSRAKVTPALRLTSVIVHGPVRYVLTELSLRAIPIATAVLFSGGPASGDTCGYVQPAKNVKRTSMVKNRMGRVLLFMLGPCDKLI